MVYNTENNKYKMCFGEKMGKSHYKTNTPCQDKALCITGNGVTAAVLSDGCGSSAFSQYGSEITVNSVGNLLINNFDELFDLDFKIPGNTLLFCKRIVKTIIDADLEFIQKNNDMFQDYKNNHLDTYNDYVKRQNDEEGFYLDTLNATLIFYAEKDNKVLMGQLGDGMLGLLIDDKLKIVLEEKKEETVNGTNYPQSNYKLTKIHNSEDGYAHKFLFKKVIKNNINGVILTTDGVSTFYERVDNDNFRKRYAIKPINNLFRSIVECSSTEEANAMLNEHWLPRVTQLSNSFDDCGISVLITPDYVLNECLIKEYERPKDEVTVINDNTIGSSNYEDIKPQNESEKPEAPEKETIKPEIIKPNPEEPSTVKPSSQEPLSLKELKEKFNSKYSKYLGEDVNTILNKLEKKCKYEKKNFLKLLNIYGELLDKLISGQKVKIIDYNTNMMYLLFVFNSDKKIHWYKGGIIKRK